MLCTFYSCLALFSGGELSCHAIIPFQCGIVKI
nr:MAG TPA: hypothetical protein [Microviridae sp.]